LNKAHQPKKTHKATDVMLPGLHVNLSQSVVPLAGGGNTTWEQAVLTVDADAEEVYTIAFHTCWGSLEASVDVSIRLVEVNPGPDYLGAGLVRVSLHVHLCMPTYLRMSTYLCKLTFLLV
jgi:hypothetical protein